MRQNRIRTSSATLVAATVGVVVWVNAGSLAPPAGPVTPTMKTLVQVEPRTDLATLPGDASDLFIISQPGSYYLTTNLVGVNYASEIAITANNVTLDLNGFALLGVPNSYDGIYIPNAQTNITVRNGSISGWGSEGVQSASTSSFNMVFERLNVSASGVIGIGSAGVCVVRDCNSQNNGANGIDCEGGGIISGCMADNNSENGIVNVNGVGAITGCTANNNVYAGFWAAPCVVSGCTATNNGIGITLNANGGAAIGNNCIGNFTGIEMDSSHSRVEDNHVAANSSAGIYCQGPYSGNIIVKNSVSGSGGNNYDVIAGNVLGPLITTTGTISSSNPWANFSY